MWGGEIGFGELLGLKLKDRHGVVDLLHGLLVFLVGGLEAEKDGDMGDFVFDILKETGVFLPKL